MKLMKILFHSALSVSLVLTPVYGYSEPVSDISQPAEDLGKELIQLLTDSDSEEHLPEEIKEASRILTEMGDAVEDGKFGEYLKNHPELADHFDILSLRNQEAGVVNERSGEIDLRIDFNTYTHQSYPTLIQNIEVEFPESQPILTFNGVIVQGDSKRKKQLGVIHFFRNIEKKDVIDWAYDKDILAILHKEKGLILYHMVFAKNILGEAPIPSIKLPVSLELLQKENLKLEFIDRSIEPPQKTFDAGIGAVFNTEGEPFYLAGDLLISHKDDQGEKRIKRIFSRKKDLYKTLFKQYVFLDFLLQTTFLKLREGVKDAQDLSVNILFLQEKSLLALLSSALNRDSLLFLKERSNHILGAKLFLLFFGDKDVFSHNTWLEDYEKLKSESIDEDATRLTGETMLSENMVKILDSSEEEINSWRRSLQNNHPKIDKAVRKAQEGFNDLKWDISVAVTAGLSAVLYAYSVPHSADSSFALYTLSNLLVFGLAPLSIIVLTARYSIELLEKFEKFIPAGPFKVKVNQAIEKWKNQDTVARLLGFSFKLAARLLPVLANVMQYSGKPHFVSVLNSELQPGRKITPESEIGRQIGLEKPQRLGLSGWHWRSSTKQYKDQEKLIDIAAVKHEKMQSLSRIITYYALSGKPFSISSLLSGLLPLSQEDLLVEIHSNKSTMKDFAWVSNKLGQYIEESSGEVYTNESVLDWNPETLKEYYEKSLELLEESKSLSFLQKETYFLGRRLTNRLRRAFLWNLEESNILSRYIPDQAVKNIFWRQLIMDHITLITIPLTPATPRGEYFAGNIHNLGISQDASYLFANPAHFHEGMMNIFLHLVISARTQLQNLSIRASLRKAFETVEGLYKPLESYRGHDNRQRFYNYVWDFLKYPFSSSGLKYEEGTDFEEPLDIGSHLLKSEKLRWRFFPVVFTGLFLSIFTVTDSSSAEAFTRGFYFFSAGLIFYGFPTIWMIIQNLAYAKKRMEVKNKINKMYQVLYKIKNNLYSSESHLRDEYRAVLEDFKKIHSSSKKVSRNISLDSLDPLIQSFLKDIDLSKDQRESLKAYIEASSVEDKMKEIKEMISLFKSPHLPTQGNKLGDSLIALLTLGIYSNIAFVFLSRDIFNDLSVLDFLFSESFIVNHPGWMMFISAVIIGGGTLGGLWLLSKLTAEKRMKPFLSKLSSGMRASSDTTKASNEKIGRRLFQESAGEGGVRQAVQKAVSAVRDVCRLSFMRSQKSIE